MKTKLKISSKLEINSFLKNRNFLNNQNYVMNKSHINYAKKSIIEFESSKENKNYIPFTKEIQNNIFYFTNKNIKKYDIHKKIIIFLFFIFFIILFILDYEFKYHILLYFVFNILLINLLNRINNKDIKFFIKDKDIYIYKYINSSDKESLAFIIYLINAIFSVVFLIIISRST